MCVGTGRQNIIILFWKLHFHFWEYINGNQTFILGSHLSFICSVDRRHTGKLKKINNLLTGEEEGRGWARSRFKRPQKAWSSIINSILSGGGIVSRVVRVENPDLGGTTYRGGGIPVLICETLRWDWQGRSYIDPVLSDPNSLSLQMLQFSDEHVLWRQKDFHSVHPCILWRFRIFYLQYACGGSRNL